jgi:hypothetical protein
MTRRAVSISPYAWVAAVVWFDFYSDPASVLYIYQSPAGYMLCGRGHHFSP